MRNVRRWGGWGLVSLLLATLAGAGEPVARSCPQELAETKAKLSIVQERRESAEHSWAYFFVRSRELEQQLKRVQTSEAPAALTQESSP